MTSTLELDLLAPTTADAVIANSRTVGPYLAGKADEIDGARQLPDDVARVLRDAGLFRMAFPASRGGLEMSLEQQLGVVTRISRVDASAGWNVGVLNATGMYAGRLGVDAYAELYPDADRPTSGSFHPRGRADRVDGGWMVSGSWDWGSGSQSAHHVLGGCFAFEGGEPVIGASGKQLVLGAWLPPESIVFAHNWQTLGVRGSGSTSYSVPVPVFVPDAHTFDREAPDDGAKDPLNKSVHIAFFGLAGVAVGIAQHAVDLAVEAVRAKRGPRPAATLDSATTQALGGILADVDHLHAGVTAVARRTDEILFEAGRPLTGPQLWRMISTQTTATQVMRRVVQTATDLVSARFLFDDHPMQRVVRDSYGAVAHVGGRAMMHGFLAQAVVDADGPGLLLDDLDAAGASAAAASGSAGSVLG
ncbi:acyl-CoA dehydrogenase family protein [Herbiconiux sp.]|uniref:acyl-CoA dehydrogenase family protein n=1 Tax=Herbiconiux sp. TaxID=1871186 RepID=UPI0025C64EF0|nr:acyl-CoA dehydrogenase family protein [Herbiconiux sp.]